MNIAIFINNECVNVIVCQNENEPVLSRIYPTAEFIDSAKYYPRIAIGDKRETAESGYSYFRMVQRWDEATQEEITEKIYLKKKVG